MLGGAPLKGHKQRVAVDHAKLGGLHLQAGRQAGRQRCAQRGVSCDGAAKLEKLRTARGGSSCSPAAAYRLSTAAFASCAPAPSPATPGQWTCVDVWVGGLEVVHIPLVLLQGSSEGAAQRCGGCLPQAQPPPYKSKAAPLPERWPCRQGRQQCHFEQPCAAPPPAHRDAVAPLVAHLQASWWGGSWWAALNSRWLLAPATRAPLPDGAAPKPASYAFLNHPHTSSSCQGCGTCSAAAAAAAARCTHHVFVLHIWRQDVVAHLRVAVGHQLRKVLGGQVDHLQTSSNVGLVGHQEAR